MRDLSEHGVLRVRTFGTMTRRGFVAGSGARSAWRSGECRWQAPAPRRR